MMVAPWKVLSPLSAESLAQQQPLLLLHIHSVAETEQRCVLLLSAQWAAESFLMLQGVRPLPAGLHSMEQGGL